VVVQLPPRMYIASLYVLVLVTGYFEKGEGGNSGGGFIYIRNNLCQLEGEKNKGHYLFLLHSFYLLSC